MLYYNRIAISEGIDLAKSNNSKEWMICNYCFFNRGFESQDYVCNGCHDLSMLCLNISDITIITIKNVNYRCIIHSISKSEATNLLGNSVLEDRGTYKKIFILNFILFKMIVLFFCFFCLVYIKWLILWTCISL